MSWLFWLKWKLRLPPHSGHFSRAGEYAGFLRDRGLFAACPFLERLHLFPSLAVNDSFMDIEKDRPVFLRVVVGGIDHAIGGKAGGCFCQPVPLKRHTVDPALLGNVLGVILVSQPRIKNDGLCFDISDKIVVDVNIAFLVIVHGIAFADLNFLNQAHQRGTV